MIPTSSAMWSAWTSADTPMCQVIGVSANPSAAAPASRAGAPRRRNTNTARRAGERGEEPAEQRHPERRLPERREDEVREPAEHDEGREPRRVHRPEQRRHGLDLGRVPGADAGQHRRAVDDEREQERRPRGDDAVASGRRGRLPAKQLAPDDAPQVDQRTGDEQHDRRRPWPPVAGRAPRRARRAAGGTG